MTDEEFLHLLEEARKEARRTVLPPAAAEGDSRYERLGRHAEAGASAH
ncbi:hypothetical protein [Streptomyces omiyaensis]|uniref:Uncharacterized protein n=1 Tax=Streptomyces omiyaensis TaxID=68247 RepID=A0ABW7BV55_9ACTN|nr:hypothetical protein [Streptomyces omiyaensis]